MRETTDVRVELVDGMAFRGVDQHGLQIVMDASAEVGGQGHRPKPIDVLAMGLGDAPVGMSSPPSVTGTKP
jgi:uncharacterized OsmC-like protein